MHVLARHDGDRLYERHPDSRYADVAERAEYADRLAAELALPRTFD